MEQELIAIGEAASRLGVSIDTLRRWDDLGKLRATRKSPGGSRYYSEVEIELFLHDLYKMAYDWAINSAPTEIPSTYYCQDSSIFQARLIKMQNILLRTLGKIELLSLLVATAGEIGNNSFDHNLGNWPDSPGIFFGYDLNKGIIVLADRGLGVLRTLKRVKPELDSDSEALKTAFTEILSSRAPEERGNGLKFVRQVIEANPISLQFQSGHAKLLIPKESADLSIQEVNPTLRGCIALIKF